MFSVDFCWVTQDFITLKLSRWFVRKFSTWLAPAVIETSFSSLLCYWTMRQLLMPLLNVGERVSVAAWDFRKPYNAEFDLTSSLCLKQVPSTVYVLDRVITFVDVSILTKSTCDCSVKNTAVMLYNKRCTWFQLNESQTVGGTFAKCWQTQLRRQERHPLIVFTVSSILRRLYTLQRSLFVGDTQQNVSITESFSSARCSTIVHNAISSCPLKPLHLYSGSLFASGLRKTDIRKGTSRAVAAWRV